MSDVNIDTQSRAELEETAADLGVTFAANIGDDKLRAKLRDALGEAPSIAPAAASEPKATTGKRFEITVATHDQDKQPVQVGVNGKNYVIERGKKVIVPEAVVKVLENAVRVEYDTKDMKENYLHSYPYTVHREVE